MNVSNLVAEIIKSVKKIEKEIFTSNSKKIITFFLKNGLQQMIHLNNLDEYVQNEF